MSACIIKSKANIWGTIHNNVVLISIELWCVLVVIQICGSVHTKEVLQVECTPS